MPGPFSRRDALLLLGTAFPAAICARDASPTYTFSVFRLLKPRQLWVSGCGPARLHCRSAGETFVLEPGESKVLTLETVPFQISGPGNQPVAFALELRDVLRREYFGTLTIKGDGTRLHPLVRMDREVAVSSITGAELPVDRAWPEALAAQAVVARSVLAGSCLPRHAEADFCDTTHCQFLRSPAPAGSVVANAVAITGSAVLVNELGLFAPRYSGACGGQTRGGEQDGHLYEAVSCETCRERGFTRRGHGWGLCQEGAMGLAHQGWTWRAILARFYPTAYVREV